MAEENAQSAASEGGKPQFGYQLDRHCSKTEPARAMPTCS